MNYQDDNLNVSIPVFSIHGNHDDPTGVILEFLQFLEVLEMISWACLWKAFFPFFPVFCQIESESQIDFLSFI